MIPAIQIYAPTRAKHQVAFGTLLLQGLRRHGVLVEMVHDAAQLHADTIVCWGWRRGRLLHESRKRVLVMERGYVGDRFYWTSLGWGGLNGNAAFHIPNDGGARFRRLFPGALQLDRKQAGDDIVIMGQVRGDAALSNYDIANWYTNTAERLEERFGRAVFFRPHPKHLGSPWAPRLRRSEGTLSEVLGRAALVVAFNSNALTDAALAGVPTMAGNAGAMTWPVASYRGPAGKLRTESVEAWAHAMAWTQWSPEEVERGDAWEVIRQVPVGAKPFHAGAYPSGTDVLSNLLS